MPEDQYIWHETIQTQDTRRSFKSEVSPQVIKTIRQWLETDRFEIMPGYHCQIVARSRHCLQAEITSPFGISLCVVGVASHPKCGQSLWTRIGGDSNSKPAEPWCAASIQPGAATEQIALYQIADFERCLAWAFLEISEEKGKSECSQDSLHQQ